MNSKLASTSQGTVRILHVEDNPDFANLTADILTSIDNQFTVETATSPREGLTHLDEVDCVVSDYDMPRMDGIELLKTVRERDCELPFILFTGKGSEEIAAEAISAGVTDYLQKTGRREQYRLLAKRIDNAVTQFRAERHAERERQRRAALFENATDPILDVAIDPDGSKVMEVNEAFEETFGYDADEIYGEDAAELLVPEEGRDVHESLKEQLLNGESVRTEVQRETVDGLRDFLVRATPYAGADSQQRVYAWYIDVTELNARLDTVL